MSGLGKILRARMDVPPQCKIRQKGNYTRENIEWNVMLHKRITMDNINLATVKLPHNPPPPP